MKRREFILGAGALAFGGGRRLWASAARPDFSFGVVSDLHVTTPESTARFRRSLAYFRDRGADAVVVTGDLSDWGLRSGFRYVADAWNAVFPNDRAPDGRKVEKVFITGNHDFDGWWYGDMTLDMHVQGYSEEEALSKRGMARCWEEAFGEPYDEIRLRRVCGYDFVSVEWSGVTKAENDAAVKSWFERNGHRLPKDRPFFFLRHAPVPGTVNSTGARVESVLGDVLRQYPNCVSFTGHTHSTLNDERSIWQDEFTAVAVPSLSYTSTPGGYENGSATRDATCALGMPRLPARFDEREAQGFFVRMYGDRMVLERYDFDEMTEAAAPWVVPLGAGRAKPYRFDAHAAATPVPAFPAGAALATRIVNADRRNGRWTIFVELSFPSARASGGRVFDYDVRATFDDGSVAATKRFLSQAFHRLERDEPAVQRVLFDAIDLPETGRYRFMVYPRNSFGAAGAPLVSRPFESKPGKERAKR